MGKVGRGREENIKEVEVGIMKLCVLATMGTSPPVVSEFIDWLERHREHVNDLVIIDTQDERVRASTKIAHIAVTEKYPKIRVHEYTLDYEDVDTTERNVDFMGKCVEIIRQEREKYNVEKIYLNVGGGRKNMCITLTLMGQLLGVNGVFHVVNKNVQDINFALERLRGEIKEIYELQDKEKAREKYRSKIEDFNNLMFPSETQYEVIQLPMIPFPSEVIGVIKTLLCEEKDVKLPTDLSRYKKMLLDAGLLYFERGHYRSTKFGEEIGKLL